ncbi:DNA-directed DNA polymerase [Bacteriovorax sp. BAL6_X]|uniref:DNA polymerase I n=1 Tax=Bacteriovorax sp. BAL6_X TaxID=1201290 RepID=UPI0003855752|nr:DNA polymerase I [Bacteriovorax sp. BAL6_X]EPZ49651.1 DNA-directed DNA polymerase [Bacteriovorax sp. BAL6_X]
MSKKRLIVVDVSNFIFRAFFAIRSMNAPDGTPVNATYGVLSMLLKIMANYRPTHMLLARDTSGGSFRNELYDQYKANRSEPPEELVPQFALIKELIDKMGLLNVANETYEADDIIGSTVIQWKDDFDEILIASGDKDLMQFVGDNIKMLDTMKDVTYDEKGVFEKMGVRPDQIVDYLSMVGDTSDNIPGMRGIGAKGAAKLLAEHDTLEKCFEVSDTFKGKKLTTAFTEHVEDAKLSKELIKIVTDIDLECQAEDSEIRFYPSEELLTFLKDLGMNSMIKRMEDLKYQLSIANGDEGEGEELTSPFEHKVTTLEELKAILKDQAALAVQTEFDSEDIHARNLVGLSISFDDNNSFFVEVNDSNEKELLELIWGNESIEVYSEHSKRDYSHLLRRGLVFRAKNFDVTLAHYNVSPSTRHNLEVIASNVNVKVTTLDKKTPFITSLETSEDKASYSGLRSIAVFRLANQLKEELKEKELVSVYEDIDNKLISILAEMEFEGVHLNKEYLYEMAKDLQESLDKIQKKVDSYSMNDTINLNSPKQVGEFLFNELSFPVVKKTKTGYSTDSSVLEELDSKNINEVPGLILQYRELGKILSTYVKALPEIVNAKTGKVHTSFNQHVAQTGRLSSVNPNLQNIPIRSETGRLVRKAFIATPGNLLLAADYSQVELRILAHYSEDPTMIKAFNEDKDIHAQTASEINGIALEEVTSDERSKAKAVNFGLMYGQSSFGLASALKISRKDAKAYIEKYFERFSKIKGFLDGLKEDAEKTGYSITMYGRKRFLPDIHSNNRTVKANAERMAINSPIQGTAADIIKCAMINIDAEMKKRGLKSKMILQVHDELIFDVLESELDEMKTLIKEGMENVVELKVPLKVDPAFGVNWYDLK